MNKHIEPALAAILARPTVGCDVEIIGGPYPKNIGKRLMVRKVHDELLTAEVLDQVIVYSDGFSNHMEKGPGELVLISPEHVKVV